MNFVNDAQKACYEKVVAYTKEVFGDDVLCSEHAPMISVMIGSAIVIVSVLPLQDDEAVVTTRSIVVTGAKISPDLAIFLLRANATTMFGAFGLSARGDIVLEHNQVGTALDREALRATMLTVARVANEYDDVIVHRWGGERALDRVDHFARLMEEEPPGSVSH